MRQPKPEIAVLVSCSIAMTMSVADTSFAQEAGAGAERYEVTITPPKRPGTEVAPEATEPSAANEPAPAADAGASVPSGAASAPAPGVAAVAVPAAPPVTKPAVPAGPPRTLQVAAFRQHERAEALRSELAESFPDVAILEVQSGGEPLYRVNVGRLPKGSELEALKKRLAAAGHPSFDVAAPAKASD